jgi:hypothetical protein
MELAPGTEAYVVDMDAPNNKHKVKLLKKAAGGMWVVEVVEGPEVKKATKLTVAPANLGS